MLPFSLPLGGRGTAPRWKEPACTMKYACASDPPQSPTHKRKTHQLGRAGACSRRNPRRTNGRSVGRGRGTSWAPSPTENTPSPTHKCHPEERNKARRTDLRGCKKHPRWCVHAKPSSTIRKRAVEGASPYGVVRYRLCIIDQPLTSKKICKRCRNFAIGACFCSRFLL